MFIYYLILTKRQFHILHFFLNTLSVTFERRSCYLHARWFHLETIYRADRNRYQQTLIVLRFPLQARSFPVRQVSTTILVQYVANRICTSDCGRFQFYSSVQTQRSESGLYWLIGKSVTRIEFHVDFECSHDSWKSTFTRFPTYCLNVLRTCLKLVLRNLLACWTSTWGDHDLSKDNFESTISFSCNNHPCLLYNNSDILLPW